MAGSFVQAVQRVPGHDLLLGVQVKFQQTNSVQDAIDGLVVANREPAGPGWIVDSSDAGPRSIGNAPYPTLTLREHNDRGETIDERLVWIVPSDFVVRHRLTL